MYDTIVFNITIGKYAFIYPNAM